MSNWDSFEQTVARCLVVITGAGLYLTLHISITSYFHN